MKIIEKIKYEFKNANYLSKIIYLNVSVFILVNILSVLSALFLIDIVSLTEKLMLPSETSEIIKQPWSLVTYMFLHENFIHLLFNMLWLHFGGNLFLQYLNDKQLINIYLLGGLFGGLIFVIAFNYLPALIPLKQNAKALGASASVLAIFFAIATKIPNYQIHLPFLGYFKLKYLAFFFITIDFLSIPKGNAGGHIAHIGGAIFGYIYIKQLQNKNGSIFSNLMNSFNKKTKKKVTSEVDIVLEKISKSGYDSLNEKEKELLFKSSKK
tara:strand:+ start:161 stop:964 length:804 start_codon:yes stop_codon:yes gene_type:complete